VSISCTRGDSCEAGGVTVTMKGQSFGPGGSTYRLLRRRWSVDEGGPALASISCASQGFCAAVNNGELPIGGGAVAVGPLDAYVFDGTRWSSPAAIGRMTLGGGPSPGGGPVLDPVPLPVGPNAVSCPSKRFCVAVTPTGGAAYYRGRAWRKGPSIDSSDADLSSVSCATPAFCIAIDQVNRSESSRALEYRNCAWSKPTSIGSASLLTSVSCPTSSFCLAVGDGVSTTYSGLHWSQYFSVPDDLQLTSVSCPTPTFCVAVGARKDGHTTYALTYRPKILHIR
jgi:hypothetical protein